VSRNQSSSGYDLGLDTLILARAGELRDDSGSRAAVLRRAGERGQASAGELRQAIADRDPAAREAAAWALTQQTALVPASIQALRTALADSDPVVRGLAAVALRNCGLCAEPALPALIERLKDADQNVRIASADAIAQLGEKAAPAVSALIEAAQPDMHPHVLRSIAAALGAIGPAASPALPLLERLREHIRVRWIAQSAIARIRNQPPPTGPEPAR
jgi:HEAT repeat protein